MEGGRPKAPLRRCVGCGQMTPRLGLVRIAYNGSLVSVDLTNKKPGRGAYICRSEECLGKAEKNRGIERSLKTAVPKAVYEELRLLLEC